MKKNYIKTKNFKENVNIKWAIKILVSSFVLSVSFSLVSDIVLTHTSIIISVIMISIFMLIGVVADMLGVAITSCNFEKLKSIKNDKVREIAESMVKNSDKISVICCDIIGDISSILSGACGASIVYKLINYGLNGFTDGLISACVSGLIACLTIFLKSLEKSIAVAKSDRITIKLALCINRFKK